VARDRRLGRNAGLGSRGAAEAARFRLVRHRDQSGEVAEFRWDRSGAGFVPVRLRRVEHARQLPQRIGADRGEMLAEHAILTAEVAQRGPCLSVAYFFANVLAQSPRSFSPGGAVHGRSDSAPLWSVPIEVSRDLS